MAFALVLNLGISRQRLRAVVRRVRKIAKSDY